VEPGRAARRIAGDGSGTRTRRVVQLDGSFEPWLEERGPTACLMNLVDDGDGSVRAPVRTDREHLGRRSEPARLDHGVRPPEGALHDWHAVYLRNPPRRTSPRGGALDAVWPHVRDARHSHHPASSRKPRAGWNAGTGPIRTGWSRSCAVAGFGITTRRTRFSRRVTSRPQCAVRPRTGVARGLSHAGTVGRQSRPGLSPGDDPDAQQRLGRAYDNRLLQVERDGRSTHRAAARCWCVNTETAISRSGIGTAPAVDRNHRPAARARPRGPASRHGRAPPREPLASAVQHPWRRDFRLEPDRLSAGEHTPGRVPVLLTGGATQ